MGWGGGGNFDGKFHNFNVFLLKPALINKSINQQQQK